MVIEVTEGTIRIRSLLDPHYVFHSPPPILGDLGGKNTEKTELLVFLEKKEKKRKRFAIYLELFLGYDPVWDKENYIR